MPDALKMGPFTGRRVGANTDSCSTLEGQTEGTHRGSDGRVRWAPPQIWSVGHEAPDDP